MARIECTASVKTDELAKSFLRSPSSNKEDELIAAFNVDLQAAGFQPFVDAFIEWGCVEHDLIHIFYADALCIAEYRPGSFKLEGC